MVHDEISRSYCRDILPAVPVSQTAGAEGKNNIREAIGALSDLGEQLSSGVSSSSYQISTYISSLKTIASKLHQESQEQNKIGKKAILIKDPGHVIDGLEIFKAEEQQMDAALDKIRASIRQITDSSEKQKLQKAFNKVLEECMESKKEVLKRISRDLSSLVAVRSSESFADKDIKILAQVGSSLPKSMKSVSEAISSSGKRWKEFAKKHAAAEKVGKEWQARLDKIDTRVVSTIPSNEGSAEVDVSQVVDEVVEVSSESEEHHFGVSSEFEGGLPAVVSSTDLFELTETVEPAGDILLSDEVFGDDISSESALNALKEKLSECMRGIVEREIVSHEELDSKIEEVLKDILEVVEVGRRANVEVGLRRFVNDNRSLLDIVLNNAVQISADFKDRIDNAGKPRKLIIKVSIEVFSKIFNCFNRVWWGENSASQSGGLIDAVLYYSMLKSKFDIAEEAIGTPGFKGCLADFTKFRDMVFEDNAKLRKDPLLSWALNITDEINNDDFNDARNAIKKLESHSLSSIYIKYQYSYNFVQGLVRQYKALEGLLLKVAEDEDTEGIFGKIGEKGLEELRQDLAQALEEVKDEQQNIVKLQSEMSEALRGLDFSDNFIKSKINVLRYQVNNLSNGSSDYSEQMIGNNILGVLQERLAGLQDIFAEFKISDGEKGIAYIKHAIPQHVLYHRFKALDEKLRKGSFSVAEYEKIESVLREPVQALRKLNAFGVDVSEADLKELESLGGSIAEVVNYFRTLPVLGEKSVLPECDGITVRHNLLRFILWETLALTSHLIRRHRDDNLDDLTANIDLIVDRLEGFDDQKQKVMNGRYTDQRDYSTFNLFNKDPFQLVLDALKALKNRCNRGGVSFDLDAEYEKLHKIIIGLIGEDNMGDILEEDSVTMVHYADKSIFETDGDD